MMGRFDCAETQHPSSVISGFADRPVSEAVMDKEIQCFLFRFMTMGNKVVDINKDTTNGL